VQETQKILPGGFDKMAPSVAAKSAKTGRQPMPLLGHCQFIVARGLGPSLVFTTQSIAAFLGIEDLACFAL